MLLIGNGQVITRDPEQPYLKNGAVVTDGARIAAVGDEETLKKAYPEAEYVDAAGGVIMPGLINAHTHIYSGLARGLSIAGYNPTNFLEILEGMWWHIDRHLNLDGTRASAYATILDCIRNGVTTIFDHHASFAEIPGSLFAIRDVAAETGMRACLCYEVSERDGEEKTEQGIRENAEFAAWAKEADDPMIKAMFGGHALFTISDRTFEKMVEANNGMTGFHIHVAEGMNDVYDSLRNYGCRPVNRLLYNGILGERTLLGHCIHVSPAEMAGAADDEERDHGWHGHGRLYPRYAGEHEGFPDHPAAQHGDAERCLERGCHHAVCQQPCHCGEDLRRAAGDPEGRGGGGYHCHGLQAIYAV